MMDHAEAIGAAIAYLREQQVCVNALTPVIAEFQPAGEWYDYDRWLVIFETHPDCDPSVTIVEIKYPDFTPSLCYIM